MHFIKASCRLQFDDDLVFYQQVNLELTDFVLIVENSYGMLLLKSEPGTTQFK
jgi:hypothetical protein